MIEENRQEYEVRKYILNAFIDKLKNQETILKNFDEALWIFTIEKVVVGSS